MAQTPWEMAAVGKEFSHQSALFAWAAMAKAFGVEAAGEQMSYCHPGHAKRCLEGNLKLGFDDRLPQLKWLHAIKNQGHGDAIRGSRSRQEGVRSGVFDIFLPVAVVTDKFYDYGQSVLCGSYGAFDHRGNPMHSHHGLYIELKKPKDGKPSDKQLEFQADIRAAGYAAEICYGWEAARDVILKYLGRD